MSKIEIDFNNLKYNLYEILCVTPDADEKTIKKKFVKVIKNFHPDKNSDLEADMYQHFILANQILLNSESKKKYDSFLINKADSFNELKDSFKKTYKNVEQNSPEKSTDMSSFKNKLDELNKKHGYTEETSNDIIIDKFNKIKQSRDDIVIEKDNIKTTNEFNNKFNTNKKSGKFKDQIIEFKGLPSELSTYIHGETYTSLSDMDKLYIEDSIQTTKFSSLDRAFVLQPSINMADNNKNFEDKLKDYQSTTEQFKNMKPTDFTVKKFNEW